MLTGCLDRRQLPLSVFTPPPTMPPPPPGATHLAVTCRLPEGHEGLHNSGHIQWSNDGRRPGLN